MIPQYSFGMDFDSSIVRKIRSQFRLNRIVNKNDDYQHKQLQIQTHKLQSK